MVKEEKIIDFYSCGRVQDVVEDLICVGVNILNPVQARAKNLALLKQICMGKIALKGGVDSYLLMLGPVEKTEKRLRG